MEVENTWSEDKKYTRAPPPPLPTPRNGRKQRRNKCLAAIALILGIFLTLLILGLTGFKVKRPVTTIHCRSKRIADFARHSKAESVL